MKNLFKKLLLTFGIIITTSFVVNISTPQQALAYDNNCRPLLGLVSWDCHVQENITNDSQLTENIWQIAANVATDITVVAAYLIIGYVIYGGYLYIFSGGEANKVATGKKALYQAFLGLAIVMSANIIMTAIRVALIGNSPLCTADSHSCSVASGDVITNAIQWVIGIAGVISAIFVVYGGISYATSAGEPSKLQKAKSMIIYALIGLAIVALAETITAFVSSNIREANQNAYINQTTISKEVYESQIN